MKKCFFLSEKYGAKIEGEILNEGAIIEAALCTDFIVRRDFWTDFF